MFRLPRAHIKGKWALQLLHIVRESPCSRENRISAVGLIRKMENLRQLPIFAKASRDGNLDTSGRGCPDGKVAAPRADHKTPHHTAEVRVSIGAV